MRFIFFSEGETHPEHTHAQRYRELIDEVPLADPAGTSEAIVAYATAHGT